MVEYRMPSLGADMESGFLREWKVKPGDRVNRNDIIAEVETQKGIIDIEVFDEGIIGELLIKEDDKVPVGTLMTYILTPEEVKSGIKPSPVKSERKKAVAELTPAMEAIEIPASVRHVRASPLAKKMAAQKGIDISTIKGSGELGAVVMADVEKAIMEQIPPVAKEKSVTENIRLAVAAAMSKSNREVPHYYLQTKVDMRNVLSWLAEANKNRSVKERVLLAAILIKAVAKALVEVPELNAWWDKELQLKKDIHVGFVVSLRTGGIIVPTIHDANMKSIDELMQSLSDVIPRARKLKLRSSELTDSTITITYLGEGAVETVFGIIYPPQVALIGFGGIAEEPWAENGMLDVRPVLTISLSADHRATDGNIGNQFLVVLKKYLLNPEFL
jgi:pyruvate dehydrogenase E2 component (dihydrolipoamide acetyltransferase)